MIYINLYLLLVGFQLKAQLDTSEHKVQALIDSNDDMRSEIAR